MARTIFSPYYYGQYRWDNYLLDIQEAVEKNSAQLQEQAEELHEQTGELRAQTGHLKQVHAELADMGREIQWGLMLIGDRLDQQIELFSRALEKLDAIHQTLKSPLMTQARELYEIGEERFKQGLLDKALESYLQSEQKNEVNFLLQRRIGLLYLEGTTQGYSMTDFLQAERHLLLAARYAEAEQKTQPNWRQFCAEAWYAAANAAYLAGEQRMKAGDKSGMRQCLERSLQFLAKSLAFWPEFTRCLYAEAKCLVLLGREQEAVERFKALSDRARNYSEVLRDKDFDRIKSAIEQVFAAALENPGPLALSAEKNVDIAEGALAWAKRSGHVVTASEAYISAAHRLLQTWDVDIEVLNRELVQTSRNLKTVTEKALQSEIAEIESQIGSLASRKTQCEQSIRDQQEKMKHTEGAGMGCLFAVLAYLGVSFLLRALVSIVGPTASKSLMHTGFPALLSALVPGVGFFLGRAISRARKKRPMKHEIGQRRLELADINRRLSTLTTRLEAERQDLQQFVAWRNTIPPLTDRPTAA